MNKKIIYAVDFFLLVGTIFGLFFTLSYTQPLAILPLDGLETSNGSVLFEFERANEILIDDNVEFSSPESIIAEDNLVVNLKPGTYYWKVLGTGFSEVRQFTIVSEVNLKLREKEESYELVNAGNTRLDVEIYEYGKKSGDIILDVDESEEVSGTKFVGAQDE